VHRFTLYFELIYITTSAA